MLRTGLVPVAQPMVEHRLQRVGMSRRQAALAAGYSVSSANNVAYNIEGRGRSGNPLITLLVDG